MNDYKNIEGYEFERNTTEIDLNQQYSCVWEPSMEKPNCIHFFIVQTDKLNKVHPINPKDSTYNILTLLNKYRYMEWGKGTMDAYATAKIIYDPHTNLDLLEISFSVLENWNIAPHINSETQAGVALLDNIRQGIEYLIDKRYDILPFKMDFYCKNPRVGMNLINTLPIVTPAEYSVIDIRNINTRTIAGSFSIYGPRGEDSDLAAATLI